ncbi:C10 family peptidase [Flavobacterium sp. KACC 22761]|uniref:C10 family peptidase n=1 Tax=Flavobacterium sp. KACC 22761 TaxID=3092665 RepID=UPI002A7490F5|nr:C10 family peptidase [Flavobacterium sp. KACC 22761]WPO77347.1 C10 family peptidase [Flavobacterium sp. KACC 22761]
MLLLLFILCIACDKQDDNQELVSNSNSINSLIALDIAKSFFTKNNSYSKNKITSNKTVKDLVTYKTSKNDNAFYVINYSEGGFLVISADNRLSPILAFSDTGTYSANPSEIPDAVLAWMESQKEQVKYVIQNKVKQNENIAFEWDLALNNKTKISQKKSSSNLTNKTKEAPEETGCEDTFYTKTSLLSTKWHQGDTFNNLIPLACPTKPGGKAPTGCVATSIAQVLFYFKKPNSYNWANMPIDYGTYDTQVLMRDAGESVNMTYSCGGSGAYDYSIVPSLKNYFKYSGATYSTTYDWNKVKNSLDQNKPVILGGTNPSTFSGHSWVCDGYTQWTTHEVDYLGRCTGLATSYLYLHMNWGWGGLNDGNYAYNNFNPGSTSYNYGINMIYNITP